MEQIGSFSKLIFPWLTFFLGSGFAIWQIAINKRNNADLEEFKSKLDRGLHVHKLQFEKEQNVYQDVWSKLIDLRKAVSELRPVLELGVSNEEEEEERKKARLVNLSVKAQCFLDQVNKERPFYAEAVFSELHELADLVRNESIDYDMGTPDDGPDYWKTRRENLTVIEEKTVEICDAIRNRLEQVSSV